MSTLSGPKGCGERDEGHLVAGAHHTLVVSIDLRGGGDTRERGTEDLLLDSGRICLEVCLSADPSVVANFAPDGNLLNALSPTSFVRQVPERTEQSAENKDRESRQVSGSPRQYWYYVKIPESAAENFLCVRAEVNHHQYGHLRTDRPVCVKVTSVCDEFAQDYVLYTRIRRAVDTEDCERVVVLADSLLPLGLNNGLVEASDCAKAIGQFDDAIRFLDARFERAGFIGRSGLPKGSDESARRIYDQERQHLVDLRDQQR